MNLSVTPEVIAALAGSLLSILFSYVPGLSTWYAAKSDEWKKLIMAGLLLAIAVAVYAMQCSSILATNITCDKQGIIQLVYMFVLAIAANQGTYRLTPQTDAVKDAKA